MGAGLVACRAIRRRGVQTGCAWRAARFGRRVFRGVGLLRGLSGILDGPARAASVRCLRRGVDAGDGSRFRLRLKGTKVLGAPCKQRDEEKASQNVPRTWIESGERYTAVREAGRSWPVLDFSFALSTNSVTPAAIPTAPTTSPTLAIVCSV